MELFHPFILFALLAGIAASFASGIVGSFIVSKRIVFISGSIAHSVLGGMGIFLWLRRTYNLTLLTPLQGALLTALLSALIIGWVHFKFREREDTIVAALWSTGMSLGVIFISLTPGYNVELMNFLFGNILWTTQSDLTALYILDVVVIGVTLLLYRRFQAICFDEDQSTLQGVSVPLYYIILLCLVAISVVLLIQTVGSILVITMLALPAAVAGSMTHNLHKMIVLAILFGCLFSLVGTYAAFLLNWPPGATIALLSAFIYALSLTRSRLRKIR